MNIFMHVCLLSISYSVSTKVSFIHEMQFMSLEQSSNTMKEGSGDLSAPVSLSSGGLILWQFCILLLRLSPKGQSFSVAYNSNQLGNTVFIFSYLYSSYFSHVLTSRFEFSFSVYYECCWEKI